LGFYLFSTRLLYFLNITLEDLNLEFGAGMFVDIDKEKALRIANDDPNSFRYGRISKDELANKVPNKKDLFQICGERRSK
jgi:hypothetical protein